MPCLWGEGKAESGGHGVITEQYVDYCRQDVAATVDLYEALMAEFRLHPVDLDPERAYSPASLSKAYLAAMGITPLLDRHPRLPPRGARLRHGRLLRGRAECRIRRVPVPVALVDFTSMYPTVDALMDLHRFQIAKSIESIDAHQRGAGTARIGHPGGLLRPGAVAAAGRLRPGRARRRHPPRPGRLQREDLGHRGQSGDLDRAALVLLGRLRGLEAPHRQGAEGAPGHPTGAGRAECPTPSVRLRGTLEIDPLVKDPMATMVEERQRVEARRTCPRSTRIGSRPCSRSWPMPAPTASTASSIPRSAGRG